MKEYTAKQIKELEKNPYVYKVLKCRIYYTAKFKEDFWVSYQAGNTPRKILEDFGFDLNIFGQKQIDSLVQHIKKQALAGNGFSEGANRKRRIPPKPTNAEELESPQSIKRMQNELFYLRQEVEFLKKNYYCGQFEREKVIMETAENKFVIIHETVSKTNNTLSVKMLCEIAGVSRAGYYNWVKAADKRDEKEKQDRADFELILKAYNFRGYDKGAQGIYMRLLHMEPPVIMNVKKIRRLMKKYGLICNIRKANPYRRMAKAIKTNNVAENLVNREFEKYGPRKILLTDITYIPFDEHFCYLSTIIDAFTKQILSYVVSESLEVDFVLETVNQMVEKHGISLATDTIIHSDQGCHYTSCSFIQLVKDKGLRQSMSRKGNCWDNAPQESFFGRMKDHIGERLKKCTTYKEIHTVIDDWMDYYNNDRYQWRLARLSPNEYYQYIITGIYPIKGRIPLLDIDNEEGNET